MPRFELNIAPVPERRGVNPFTREALTIPGRPGKTRFWEVEQQGTTLFQCSGDANGRVTLRTALHDDEDAARFELGTLVVKKRRAGYVEVGPSRELAPPEPPQPAGSALLAEEYFAAGDPRFLDEVLRLGGAQALANRAAAWYADRRPFARSMLLAYIDDGLDRPEHKALVKRLFKLAEKARDDEAMAHFMVACDRLARRSLVQTGAVWNAELRRAEPVKGLRGDPLIPSRIPKNAKGKHETSPRFSLATRMYMARRAFRYFRLLGRKDLARYGRAMRAALALYRDEHLSTPARLLDAWGLMHALYRYSPALTNTPRGLLLAPGHALSELQPAPYFPDAWQRIFGNLVVLLLEAKSRPVRAFALTLLRKSHDAELKALPFGQVRLLLQSPYEEVQRLGAELLATVAGLEMLPLREWLELLRIPDLDALALVCDAVKKYVTPSRLTLEQCIDLASAKVASIATLGLGWAKEKSVRTDANLRIALRLVKAGVPKVRTEGAAWCASLIERLPVAKVEHLRELCDAPFADARAEGFALFTRAPRFAEEPALWFALTESPYDDVRAFVITHAKAWRDKAEPSTLAHVWTSALLSVHRGGPAKRRVPRELADRIIAYPGEANLLLPVLGFALRSVRPTERVLALAALARAVTRNEVLRELAQRHVPEIVFSMQVTS